MGLDAIIGSMSNTGQVVLPQIAQERLDRLKTRTARVGVIGLGYVGLPLSLLLAEAGFKVTGFDIDVKKVDALETGRSYIFRITAEEIAGARAKGFTATAEFARLSDQDAIILCVPTPLTEHHEPDLSFIENTAKAAAFAWPPSLLSSCANARRLHAAFAFLHTSHRIGAAVEAASGAGTDADAHCRRYE